MGWNKVVWSPVELDYLRKHKTYPVNQLTIALSKSQSAVKKKLKELDASKDNLSGPIMSKRSKIGKRKDCGNLFFRSGWEANTYRLMQREKDIKFVEYEPRVFTFTTFGIIRGTVSYTPDFKVTYTDGSYQWLEVKGGFLKSVDKTKIRRFKKFFPEEFEKLVAVTPGPKSKTAKFFQEMEVEIKWFYPDINKQYKKEIPHWE